MKIKVFVVTLHHFLNIFNVKQVLKYWQSANHLLTTQKKIMYAIVEIAGQQFKVEKDRYIYTHRLEANEGDVLTFDKVLLTEDNGTVNVGKPIVSGAKVTAKVLGHAKGDKVIVFKKKRRKGYAKKNGHRQQFTKVLIEDITL